MPETILEAVSNEQFQKDYTRYGIYILYRRVLTDFKDGLKPVQRRILVDMYKNSHATDNFVKSATIVGSILGKYHPHGDTSVYGSMKPMANWFECYMPLIQPKGNWGTFQGDVQAAYRYTECHLTKFALDAVLDEIMTTPDSVDWSPNYNGNLMEPDYLPVKVPLLLINGSFGIGLGMKADIPTHNINEVIDATLALMDDRNAEVVLIPDHCMACDIVNTDWRAISRSGFGHYTVRARIDIEPYKNNRTALVVKSVPNLTFLKPIMDKIETAIATKKLIQVEDAHDESSLDQMRYVIVLKPGSDPEYVKQTLYANTQLEQTIRVNFETLNGLNPLRMSYKSYLLSFIDFRKMTKFRVYSNKLQAVQTRIHERDAYIKLLESGEVDTIIAIIRKQKNVDDKGLIEYLVKRLKITDLQAQYIINVNLKRIAIGYLPRYKQEMKEAEEERAEIMRYLMDERLIENEIRKELIDIKNKYGKPRNCRVVDANTNEIPKGAMTVVITEKNFVRKIPQGTPINTIRNDSAKSIVSLDNTDNILVFDEMGKVYKLPVYKIPLTDKSNPGIDIRFLIRNLTANIASIIPESVIKKLASESVVPENKYYLVTLTKSGLIKRMDLDDFVTVPPSGVLYVKVDKTDFVKDILIAHSSLNFIVYSDRKAVIMSCNHIPYQKRNTKGSKSMSDTDYVDGMCVIGNGCTDIVVITQSGRVNRLSILEGLPNTGKGKSGRNMIKLSADDKIVSIVAGTINDKINVMCLSGIKSINIGDLKVGSSISTGEKLINTRGDQIIRCWTQPIG